MLISQGLFSYLIGDLRAALSRSHGNQGKDNEEFHVVFTSPAQIELTEDYNFIGHVAG